MMKAAEIKHGMTVTVPDGGVWEILDRHPRPGHWWLHSRDAAGAWQTTYEHQNYLQPAGLGSRQETLLPMGLAA